MIEELLIQLTSVQQEMIKGKAEEMGIPAGAMGKTTMLELILEAHAKQIERLDRNVQELTDMCAALCDALLGCEYKMKAGEKKHDSID